MTASVDELRALENCLMQLACPVSDGSALLIPGEDRQLVVVHLLRLLVQPVALEQLLARMDSAEEATLQRLPLDERNAYKHAALLNSVGILASPDEVRGSACYQTSFCFLHDLATTVCQQQALRPAQSSTSLNTPHDLAPTMTVGAASQYHLQSAILLERVCERANRLFQESSPLFPSDVMRAYQPFSNQAALLLKNQKQLHAVMQQTVQQLQDMVDKLSSKVSYASDQDWDTSQVGCVDAAQAFMMALNQFLEVYRRELAVWCESSEQPQTYGFGRQASDMLSVATQLSDMVRIVEVVKSMHAAIATSAAPLQNYTRQGMLQQAAYWQQEAARLGQEVDVLTRTQQRQASKDPGMARRAVC